MRWTRQPRGLAALAVALVVMAGWPMLRQGLAPTDRVEEWARAGGNTPRGAASLAQVTVGASPVLRARSPRVRSPRTWRQARDDVREEVRRLCARARVTAWELGSGDALPAGEPTVAVDDGTVHSALLLAAEREATLAAELARCHSFAEVRAVAAELPAMQDLLTRGQGRLRRRAVTAAQGQCRKAVASRPGRPLARAKDRSRERRCGSGCPGPDAPPLPGAPRARSANRQETRGALGSILGQSQTMAPGQCEPRGWGPESARGRRVRGRA